MKAIQIISQDLFDKVRSRFTNLEMGDETGAVTIDPAEARFFDFDFVIEGNNLGRVSISLNELGSLKVYYSQGITENQDDPAKQKWYSFLKEMRFFAMRRLLRFDTRDITKTNLDKNDFQHLATTQAPKEEEMSNTMNESRWNHKSTKKTSRAVKGRTEVIVRHAKPVDEMFPGSRSQRKNIKAIFIQNHDGERFKYPFIHPAGAFAMAQHVDHGGVPHDSAGKAIVRMSEQIAQLQEFQRKVHSATLHDDATGITERAIGRLQELKARVEALGKRHHYESWVAEFNENEIMNNDLTELDAVTMEQYKQTFTQTNFQEELASFFPLLHSIMSEANKIDLEDYVQESEKDGTTEEETKEDAFSAFENWAEAVEQGKLADDQITALKQALEQLPQGDTGPELDLEQAYNFFNEFGINDSKLENAFQDETNRDPDIQATSMQVFQSWAKENYPELLPALGMTGAEAAAPSAEPAPAPTAEPAPAPEQPVAEGPGIIINGKEVDRSSLEVDGVDSRDYPDFSDAYFSSAYFTDGTELTDEEMDELADKYGDLLHDMAYDSLHENEEMKGREGMMPTREGIVKEVAKIVKSFYNADNPNVGPFRGTENIALDCKKQVAEKFGDKAGEFAEGLAGQFIEKLTNEWHQKHGNVGDDGLARLKELLGNIKTKVEGIGDQGMGGRDFNKNIMPAEESGPDKSQVPAYKRKEQGGDWKMSTKDLEKEKTNSPTSSAGLARRKAELGMSEELSSIMKLSGLAK